MDDDRPWLGDEPTGRPDTSFPPFLTGLGFFLAIAGPIVFAGVAKGSGTDRVLVAVGILVGAFVGIGVGLIQSHRGGAPFDRGPRL